MPPLARSRYPRWVLAAPVKAPFLVAEQLGFDQSGRNRPAVDRHERLLGPRAHAMDGVGHQLLARAALAHDQHRGLGVRHALDQVIDLDACPAMSRTAARSA